MPDSIRDISTWYSGSYISLRGDTSQLPAEVRSLIDVFSGSADGFCLLDESLTILHSNPRLVRLVGRRPEGRALADLLPAINLAALLNAPLPPDDSEPAPEMPVHLDGQGSFGVRAIPLSGTGPCRWALVLREQDERQQLERQRSMLIDLLSHEVRGPLTSVVGYASMLKEDLGDFLPDDLRESLEGIVAGSRHLTETMEELIWFTMLNRESTSSFRMTTVPVYEVIGGVVSELEGLAGEQQVSVEVAPPDGVDRIVSNELLLRLSLFHLVENGIKFNVPGGRVWVEAGHEAGEVAIQVHDSGIGIPPEEMENIFLPLYQVADHRTRHVGGLGMGLAVVQQAVRRLGGNLAVHSRPGQGTDVTLTFANTVS